MHRMLTMLTRVTKSSARIEVILVFHQLVLSERENAIILPVREEKGEVEGGQ